MGIQVWQRRVPPVIVPEPVSVPPVAGGTEGICAGEPAAQGDVALLDWNELQARVAGCTRCALHKGRTQTVFGVGDPAARWMIIGEAPGADEDRQGEPFVGRAGKLLNAMLLAIGLKREQVYIANIVKCRPPNNRDPLPEEAAACAPYLRRQIDLIQPSIILAVGRIATHHLLKTDQPMSALRGRRFNYADTDIPVVATYHPAYLLRSPKEKRKAWADLQFAHRIFSESIPGR
ncbi:MAG: uracil-DNA glycosylase [Gammaproteobacteria bacterium]|nr:uracil-DNA glycosylase [Gammaproteobacteria bacterium]